MTPNTNHVLHSKFSVIHWCVMDERTNFHTESIMRKHVSLWNIYHSKILKAPRITKILLKHVYHKLGCHKELYAYFKKSFPVYKVKSSGNKYLETYKTIIGHTVFKSWGQLWTSTHGFLLLYVWDGRRLSEIKKIDLFIFIPISTFVFASFQLGNKGSLSIFDF